MLQEYLDQLFDAFKEGICISDVEGTVVHLNRRHAEITGIPREEMLGHSVMEFVRRGRLDVVLNPEVMRTGQPATRVQTVSDGRKLILEANPVFDAQGKLVLCITFLRDVTMLSEMREQMSVQKELLEAFQQLSTAGDAQELSRKTPKLFTSSAMIKLYGEVNTIAETDATVLLLGETGVGKDVIARRIHALSLRKNKTFIKVDCGSIPENLIETELFGYAAGTFSGASKTGKIGLIEAAAGGTLFLDEIGDLPLTLQGRLLRVLQERELVRVGGTQVIPLDVRVLCATHQDLRQLVAEERFRADLFYRLNVLSLRLPPLRERLEDIVDLAVSHLREHLDEPPAESLLVSQLERPLLRHPWPGNIRELLSLMERMAIVANHMAEVTDWEQLLLSLWEDPPLEESPITPSLPQEPEPPLTLRSHMAREEARFIRQAVARCGGDMGKAAHLLGISRMTLWRKLQGLAETNAEHFE